MVKGGRYRNRESNTSQGIVVQSRNDNKRLIDARRTGTLEGWTDQWKRESHMTKVGYQWTRRDRVRGRERVEDELKGG